MPSTHLDFLSKIDLEILKSGWIWSALFRATFRQCSSSFARCVLTTLSTLLPTSSNSALRSTCSVASCDRSPRSTPSRYRTPRSVESPAIQPPSSRGMMLPCWPRHHVRMLVPERGDPTMNIGRGCRDLNMESLIFVNLDHPDQPSPISSSPASSTRARTFSGMRLALFASFPTPRRLQSAALNPGRPLRPPNC